MPRSLLPRALALASIAAVLVPASAVAMPLRDPVSAPAPKAPATTTIVREVPADDGGQTLALIMSGAALVVAAGAAARTVRIRPAMAGPAVPTSPRPGGRPGR